ncbi:hypothetical protein HAX54_013124 [Datura stramonium]|uniref:Uncharacterized protein n=1 Tax=Datura stramonium TaxID=4076 RepID=A0ABS8TKR4_DATST|nr:hypothetical protein [Datura stramonium]
MEETERGGFAYLNYGGSPKWWFGRAAVLFTEKTRCGRGPFCWGLLCKGGGDGRDVRREETEGAGSGAVFPQGCPMVRQ